MTAYEERISSGRTTALFLVLTMIFLVLSVWRWTVLPLGALFYTFAALCMMFLFYVLNYRVLVIQISPSALKLKFGIFTWTVPLDNLESCRLDEIPAHLKYGGAGIHFMTVAGRYRASFNFLEYPRVVVALKKKAGLVRDISFSTRRPEEVLRYIEGSVMA